MKHQWMPLFWGDFLANTLHLTAQETGAYFFLIAHAWEHGGVIPCDQAQQIARVDNRHWRRVRGKLEPFFEVERDAKGLPRRYVHGRVLNELTFADELKRKRSAAGMAGAIARWGKPMANAKPNAWQRQCDRNGKLPSKKDKPSFLEEPRAREAEPPQGVGEKKKPSDASRADLEAMFAAKRPKEG